MFNDFGTGARGGGGEWQASVHDLGVAEARILWALRRLVLLQPLGHARCHAVHIALQQEFGDAGLGIEHLLRCWLVGLARVSRRRLAIGEPACPLLLPDEAVLLGVLRHASDPEAGRMLAALTGAAAAAELTALFAAVQTLAGIS